MREGEGAEKLNKNMLTIENGNPDKKLKVSLTISGWVVIISFVFSLAGVFYDTRANINDSKDDIRDLRQNKLDSYRYERDRQFDNYKDSVINCKLDLILRNQK